MAKKETRGAKKKPDDEKVVLIRLWVKKKNYHAAKAEAVKIQNKYR
ncbi:MAG TPA: hypothetical protein PKA77_16635 [Chitinophagaceae bacterium]|nr:hypothetical protein [Chitinophagaceae bacterium]